MTSTSSARRATVRAAEERSANATNTAERSVRVSILDKDSGIIAIGDLLSKGWVQGVALC